MFPVGHLSIVTCGADKHVVSPCLVYRLVPRGSFLWPLLERSCILSLYSDMSIFQYCSRTTLEAGHCFL